MGTLIWARNRRLVSEATDVGRSPPGTLTLNIGSVDLQLNVDYIYRELVPNRLPPAYSETTLRLVGPEASPGPTRPRFNIIGPTAIVAG